MYSYLIEFSKQTLLKLSKFPAYSKYILGVKHKLNHCYFIVHKYELEMQNTAQANSSPISCELIMVHFFVRLKSLLTNSLTTHTC